MPEIDTDLFQLLTLVLLGLLVIVGLAIRAAIGKLRKTFERVSEAQAWPGQGASPQHYEAPRDVGAGVAEMPDAAAAEAERPAAEPVTEVGTSGAVAAEEPAPEPEVATPTAARVETEPEPAVESAQPVTATVAAESVGAAAQEPVAAEASTAAEEEPEEQPFERGGRWWFRRGDELLVYDDASGQWQPAPAEESPPASTQEIPTTLGDVGRAQEESAEAPAEDADAGAFWKCPSCGAVNGSTATSCRMCFTAKP